jgi:UDP-2,3-diacylglucosamine pyrophosphatase LpxH
MLDAVCISDIHLGSTNCKSKELCDFLDDIDNNIISTKRLIINGDLFDSIEFRRLKKKHWKVLSSIRKLSDKIEVIWIKGNHDEYAHEIVSHLIGSQTCLHYVFDSGDKKIIMIHGDIFDKFIVKYPTITWIADWAYHLIQKIDSKIAKYIKRKSKIFLRCTQIVEEKAKRLAEKNNCDIVCCGHTHLPVCNFGEISYCNSGCWVESLPTYLIVNEGKVELHHYLR